MFSRCCCVFVKYMRPSVANSWGMSLEFDVRMLWL